MLSVRGAWWFSTRHGLASRQVSRPISCGQALCLPFSLNFVALLASKLHFVPKLRSHAHHEALLWRRELAAVNTVTLWGVPTPSGISSADSGVVTVNLITYFAVIKDFRAQLGQGYFNLTVLRSLWRSTVDWLADRDSSLPSAVFYALNMAISLEHVAVDAGVVGYASEIEVVSCDLAVKGNFGFAALDWFTCGIKLPPTSQSTFNSVFSSEIVTWKAGHSGHVGESSVIYDGDAMRNVWWIGAKRFLAYWRRS